VLASIVVAGHPTAWVRWLPRTWRSEPQGTQALAFRTDPITPCDVSRERGCCRTSATRRIVNRAGADSVSVAREACRRWGHSGTLFPVGSPHIRDMAFPELGAFCGIRSCYPQRIEYISGKAAGRRVDYGMTTETLTPYQNAINEAVVSDGVLGQSGLHRGEAAAGRWGT